MVVVVELWPRRTLVRPVLGTGSLGGFTSFSAYVMDFEHLPSLGAWATAAAYVVATPVLAVLAAGLTVRLTRLFLDRRHDDAARPCDATYDHGRRVRPVAPQAALHRDRPPAHRGGMAGATVLRGIKSFGASSPIHTSRLLSLSKDLSVVVIIVDVADKFRGFLPELDELVSEGLVIIDEVEVIRYVGRTPPEGT